MPPKDFEQVFNKYRKAKGYTQVMLAAEIDVHASTVNRWIKGPNNIPYEKVKAISDLWKLTIEEQREFFDAAGYALPAEPDAGPPKGPKPGAFLDNIRNEIRNEWPVIEERTRGFVGRKFVFEAIQDFLQNPKIPRGYFLIHGQPGIGKTTLAAQLVKTEKYVHHFNSRPRNVRTAEQFLRNICAQLIIKHRLGDTHLPQRAGLDGDFFLELLNRISRRLTPGEQIIVVIDALDEVDNNPSTAGTNILYLPELELLPRGTYIIATVRTGVPVHLDTERTLYIDHDSENNKADIREFIKRELVLKGIKEYIQAQSITDEYFVDLLFEKSEGNFMYLHHVLRAIASGIYSGQNIKSLPSGLKKYYEEHWSLMRDENEDAWHKYKLPILMELVAADEPVSVDMLQKLTGIRERTRIVASLGEKGWGQFLYISPDKRYSLYHTSFRDFLATKDELEEGVSIRIAKLKIADALFPDDLWGE